MKLIVTILAIFVANEVVQSARIFQQSYSSEVGGILSKGIQEGWIKQPVDHFNTSDGRFWNQRYFLNDEYAKSPRNVALLIISGETEASVDFMIEGEVIEIAKTLGAAVFQLEHRFYGQSHPFKRYSTKNLKYLTPDQALADIANFTQGIKKEHQLVEGVKWIVFGTNYGGSLAAWMRLKYPKYVVGAVANSAPLKAQANFAEFFPVIYEALRSYGNGNGQGDKCVSAVEKAFQQFEEQLNSEKGHQKLDEQFLLCSRERPLSDKPNDIADLLHTLTSNFVNVVQLNNVNLPGDSPNDLTIDNLCDIMVAEEKGSELNRLADLNAMMMKVYGEVCLPYSFYELVTYLKDEQVNGTGERLWTYQQCTQFGLFPTTDAKPHAFGTKIPLRYYTDLCSGVFGPKYNEATLVEGVKRTNELYKGLELNVTNVAFIHGSFDPIHVLGITKTRNEKAPAIYIEGAGHGTIFYPSWDKDTPQVKAARKKVRSLIGSWLKEK